MTVVVTADIIGSRALADRASAQRELDDAIVRVEADLPAAIRPLTPTVGDELQGIYPTLDAALASILLLRLTLPDGIDCRFGVGIGAVGTVPSRAGDIAEGPGWWAARDAIDTLHAAQVRAMPAVRTWVAAASGGAAPQIPAGAASDAVSVDAASHSTDAAEAGALGAAAGGSAALSASAIAAPAPAPDIALGDTVRLANAYVWARDELVTAMTTRARRLVYGRCLGQTQRSLAEREGISQPAVSQLLAASGAAVVVAGFRALTGDG